MQGIYDLIIIGAGPAGITASVYAARKRMRFLIVSKDIGGQTIWSGEVENYPGCQFISGADLASKFEDHMRKYDIELKEDEEVVGIEKKGKTILVRSSEGSYETRTVIIASGKKSRELGLAEEGRFKNRGLTYCATCDGPLFAGKDVAVIGGGNSALDAALQLMNIANHVYIVNAAPVLTGDEIMAEKLKDSEKVSVFNNSRVTAVTGEKFVNSIKIEKDREEESISVEGVFVEIGLIPNSGFVLAIEKNDLGEIKVNSYNETNVKGIFAAGDVTDVPEKQIIIAAGEGAKACLSAFKYLVSNKF